MKEQQRRYGYSAPVWRKAKGEAREILIAQAKSQNPIPYSELADRIVAIRFEPDSHSYHALLGEISEDEDAAGRGMLSVLVVHKDGDMQPGPGFFNLAKQLGRKERDKLKLWVEESKKVYQSWAVS